MRTDPAGKTITYSEVSADSVKNDKTQPRPTSPLSVQVGAWQAYLNKVLPPLPEHP